MEKGGGGILFDDFFYNGGGGIVDKYQNFKHGVKKSRKI